jgi:hypothetical protein
MNADFFPCLNLKEMNIYLFLSDILFVFFLFFVYKLVPHSQSHPYVVVYQLQSSFESMFIKDRL